MYIYQDKSWIKMWRDDYKIMEIILNMQIYVKMSLQIKYCEKTASSSLSSIVTNLSYKICRLSMQIYANLWQNFITSKIMQLKNSVIVTSFVNNPFWAFTNSSYYMMHIKYVNFITLCKFISKFLKIFSQIKYCQNISSSSLFSSTTVSPPPTDLSQIHPPRLPLLPHRHPHGATSPSRPPARKSCPARGSRSHCKNPSHIRKLWPKRSQSLSSIHPATYLGHESSCVSPNRRSRYISDRGESRHDIGERGAAWRKNSHTWWR